MANNHYQPLFLKYRPQKLEDILGQNSVKETLINAIKNQKIVHSYLLTGPRGSGKTSTARILAKSLNCLQPSDGMSPSISPCGLCESCVGIANSSSQDVVEIDAASHGGVEDARKLIEKVNFASISGKYRIYIIDEVHMLSTAAFNALLKTIEEPPPNVVFILATTELDKVMKTIVSRCQQLRFKSITISDCIERLNYVSAQESINIDAAALKLIAEHSDGAMRDALSLLDQLSVFSQDASPIDSEKVLEILGALPQAQLNELAKNILESNVQGLLAQLEILFTTGKDPSLITRELANYFVILLEQQHTASNNKFAEIQTLIKENKIENFEIVQIIDSLSELESKFRQTINSKNLLRAWLIKLCYRADIFVVRDLLARVEALESGSGLKNAEGSKLKAQSSTLKDLSSRGASRSEAKDGDVVISPSEVNSHVIYNDNKSTSPEPTALSSRSTEQTSFLDHLSPGSRGMFVSSNAKFISISGGTALIQMPSKFKFLKSKLETRQEELLAAIAKQEGTEVSSILIEVVDETESQTCHREEDAVRRDDLLPKREITEPVLRSGATSGSPSAPHDDKQSSSTNSKNLKLDEVVTAGINFFGGKEI